jgi:hypothetical protein
MDRSAVVAIEENYKCDATGQFSTINQTRVPAGKLLACLLWWFIVDGSTGKLSRKLHRNVPPLCLAPLGSMLYASD